MDVQQHEVKPRRFSRPWLRWSEYGSVLAVIPGLFLSILTGQFAFAASPLTLSLWLNLLRRQYSDRHTLQLLCTEQQGLIYRYESVIESTKRERAELLMNCASELDERDHPQLINVLDFRLHCVEKNRELLQVYLDESYRAIEVLIREIQGWQEEQTHSLEQIARRVAASHWPESVQQEVQDRLQSMSEQVETLEHQFLSPPLILVAELKARLQTLEQSLEKIESHVSVLGGNHSEVQKFWIDLETPLIARLEELRLSCEAMSSKGYLEGSILVPQLMDAVFEDMHLSVTEKLNDWEVLQQDQGYKMQRLHEKLATLQQTLEQTYQVVLENSMALEQMLISSQLAVVDTPSELELETVKTQVTQLHDQLEETLSSAYPMTLDSILNPIHQTVDEQIERMNGLLATTSLAFDEEQFKVLLTPLLHHLSDCDEKLSQITEAQLSHNLEGRVLDLESRILTLSESLESLGDMKSGDLTLYNRLHVQLSVIRYQAEALKSQVAIELEQIPYAIENCLRQRYPIPKL